MKILQYSVGAVALLILVGCATQKPVLYPNAQLSRVGKTAADRDIEECMQKADAYIESESRAGRAAGDAAVGATSGAIIGGAAGAAGGAIVGRPAVGQREPHADYCEASFAKTVPARCTRTSSIAACVKKVTSPSAGNS